MNHIDLNGHVAVITGGSSGIGLATAARMLTSGASVVVWDLDERLFHAAGLVGAGFQRVDITDADAVRQAARQTLEQRGQIDILVNSAGIAGDHRSVRDYPAANWRRVIEVNLVGTFLCCQAVLETMQQRDYGRIVNLSSTGGKEGNPFVSAYGASKAGVIALTKSLAKELAETGIRVNCVTPAAIGTALFNDLPPERRRASFAKIPMGRVGLPDEVAALIAWMASPECSFSTGAAFDISGGRSTY